ncbi:MAG: DUF523 domain-containing protein [Desulfovibrio sp.]|uniref:DUF523 domain-containing protein n=1 Tax=Desulfovibrio sp. TaxID=885 RepID=UPI002584E8D0|nr:DUF523 domain-containing protein [Desulfovibrio sp.]MCD7984348.1 DUF523 domain-containing protein [Desulfovibrio sp.]
MADAPRIRYVVSGCLAGLACRYDGGSNPCAAVIRLVEEGRAIPACPENLAGLPVPRLPCELAEGSVLSRDGRDLTEDFLRGAQLALRTAQSRGCTAAILKSRSPSCGFGRIYDGTFSRTLCPGEGVWARLLREAGFALFSEEHLPPELGGKGEGKD